MLGIGLLEFFVILFVAFLLFKPKDFINFITTVFKLITKFKNYLYGIQNEFKKIELLNNFDDYVVIDKKSTPVNTAQSVNKPTTSSSLNKNKPYNK